MARTDTLGHFLTDVADAIREKKGTSETIQASDFDTEIENLPSGSSRDWTALGYPSEPPAIQEDYEDAITIKNNWDATITNAYQKYYNDSTVTYFPKVDMTNITSAYQMFYLANRVLYADLDLPNATTVSSIFDSAYTLQYAKIKTSNKNTSIQNMFYSCKALKEVDVSEMDVSKVTTMSRAFCLTPTLKVIDLSAWETTSVLTNLSQMFNGSGAETIIFGEDFDTSNVTAMSGMFANCIDLSTITGLDNFDTRKVTTMDGIFQTSYNKPGAITSLDLSSFETPLLTNTQNMFAYRAALTHIDMRKFDFSNVTSYSGMFGANGSYGPPNDCEIIVADATQKNWLLDKFSRLTNVKTVAEYEAEQNQ